MLSFAANRATTGFDPFYFKITNLAIHLLNGWLVYAVVRRLLAFHTTSDTAQFAQSVNLASVTAAVWLLHPAQLTSVLYVVQRMTSLSATFLFLGLLVYLRARKRMRAGGSGGFALWAGVPFLGGLSCLAKENGALLFPLALVAESCVLRFTTGTAMGKRELRFFFLIFVGLPLAAAIVFLMLHPGWLVAPQSTRPFNVVERLMTESRVLFLYLQILFVPTVSSLALYYDDFTISRGLLEPATTLFSIVTWCALIIVAVTGRRRWPWFTFAILWFLVAHLVESTVIMLELVHVHRNYVAYVGPILAGVVGCRSVLAREAAKLAPPIAITVTILLSLVTAQRAQQWGHPLEQAAFEVHHRPNSPRANYELGRLYFIAAKDQKNERLRQEARKYFKRAMELDTNAINAPVALLIVDGGRHVDESVPAKLSLLERLKSSPLSPSDVHYLRSIVDCQQYVSCRRSPQDIIDIFASALSHPSLKNRVKANLLSILGMYYATHLGDIPACLRTMREAVSLMPDDPNYRLNLVHAYLVAQNLDEAKKTLEEAVAKDKLGIYNTRIKSYRIDIQELEKT